MNASLIPGKHIFDTCFCAIEIFGKYLTQDW